MSVISTNGQGLACNHPANIIQHKQTKNWREKRGKEGGVYCNSNEVKVLRRNSIADRHTHSMKNFIVVFFAFRASKQNLEKGGDLPSGESGHLRNAP